MAKIGLAALLIHPSRFGGAETYARELIPAIARVDRENQYVVFLPKGHDFVLDAPNFEIVECPCPVENIYARVCWEHVRYPAWLRKFDLDLTHFLGSTAPYSYSRPSVVAMHDTLRIQRPDLTPFILGQYYRRIQRRNVQSGMWVIAGSAYAASLLREELRISPEKLSYVYYGIDSQFSKVGSSTSPVEKKHLLWAGRMFPHKNVEILFHAYEILHQKGISLPEFRLIGATEADRKKFCPLLEQKGIAHLFRLENKLSHQQWREEFPRLCQEALIYVFPSKYESFGMPVLEAMATGTVCVCSDLPAFREVFGNHVKYCQEDDAGQFADAILSYLLDQEGRQRDEQRNQQFASKFTWENAAIRTLEVYQRQIGERFIPHSETSEM